VGLPEPNAFQRLLPTNIIWVLAKLATDSESVAEDMERRYKNAPNIYFRLNVDQGMQGITLEAWKKLHEVTAHTKAYLQKVGVSQKVDILVNVLTGQSPTSGLLVSELRM
jgi:hypothetical protein